MINTSIFRQIGNRQSDDFFLLHDVRGGMGLNCDIVSFIAKTVDTRSNHPFIIINHNFKVEFVNNAFCQWVEKEENELLGFSLVDLFYKGKQPDFSNAYYYPLIKTLQENIELSGVECYLPIPKQDNWCLVNTYLHRSDSGHPQYVAACYVLIDKYKAVEDRLKGISVSVIKSFAKAIDARDDYTGKHSEHVAKLMVDFAEYLRLNEEEVSLAYLSGMVHDIGKVGIPEKILNKPTRLEQHEFAFIKRHPDLGADILSEIDELEEIAEVVRYHHERYDGKGYPYGFQGINIPPMSRMLALCDSYDAMTTVRCYRKPFTPARALQEIEQASGTQFDPYLGKRFISFISKAQSHSGCVS